MIGAQLLPDQIRSVAVLIPAFNASRFIGSALESIARQSRPPDQVVVVDDGSSDGTADTARRVAASLSMEVEVIRQPNRGASAARNTGLQQVRCQLVAPLDADDVLLPNHLECLERAFREVEGLVVSFGDQRVLSPDGAAIDSFLSSTPVPGLDCDVLSGGIRVIRAGLFETLVRSNCVPTSASMISMSALKRAGHYDQRLATSEDRELLLRVSRFGGFAYYADVLAVKNDHPGNLTSGQSLTLATNAFSALLLTVEKSPWMALNATEVAALQGAVAECAESLLYHASREGVGSYLKAKQYVKANQFEGYKPSLRHALRALFMSLVTRTVRR